MIFVSALQRRQKHKVIKISVAINRGEAMAHALP